MKDIKDKKFVLIQDIYEEGEVVVPKGAVYVCEKHTPNITLFGPKDHECGPDQSVGIARIKNEDWFLEVPDVDVQNLAPLGDWYKKLSNFNVGIGLTASISINDVSCIPIGVKVIYGYHENVDAQYILTKEDQQKLLETPVKDALGVLYEIMLKD